MYGILLTVVAYDMNSYASKARPPLSISMMSYPKIKDVVPLPDKCLQVTFVNNISKIYDCKPLLKEKEFSSLEDDVLFNAVKSDQGGYGVSWNEEIDLSESELWINGLHSSV